MGERSVYRYLRPLIVLCHYTGQLTVGKLFADDSSLLRHRLCTVSTLMFALTSSISFRFTLLNLLENSHAKSYFKFLYYGGSWLITFSVNLFFFVLGSKDAVKAMKVIDRLGATATLIPEAFRGDDRPSGYRFPLVCCSFLLITNIPLIEVLMNEDEYPANRSTFFPVTIHVNRFPYRFPIILASFVFYCNHHVRDLLLSWRRYSARCHTASDVKDFARCLSAQTGELNVLQGILSRHIFVSMVFRVWSSFWILMDVEYVVNGYLAIEYMVVGTFSIGLLIYSVQVVATQFEDLVEQILEMPTQELSRRDKYMVITRKN